MLKLLIFIMTWPAGVFASSNCLHTQTDNLNQFICPNIQIDQITEINQSHMRLLFNDGFSMELSVSNNQQLPSFQYDQKQKDALTPSDKKTIQEAVEAMDNQGLTTEFSMIRFFESLPTNEALKPLTDIQAPAGEVPWPNPPKDDGESGEVPWPNKKNNKKKL